ncbi:MAG: hypothetical protein QME41_00195 [Actinomycetota bacterium]|nr:hypothetical protein [Actinomycetota bacterium]
MAERTDVKDEIKGAQPRDILLKNESAEGEFSAVRIEAKRRRRRLNAMLRAKQILTAISLILSVGLLIYIVSEINLLSFQQNGAAIATETVQETSPLYECFATVGTSSLGLALPARQGSVVGVGFHQAERREAVAMAPVLECYDREATATVRNAVIGAEQPVLFIMESRGRGSAPTSAMDIALAPNSEVLSPVNGVVTVVKTYELYSKVTDYHVEIQPDGYPNLRIAIIHIDDVRIRIGQRLEKGETVIGALRPLPQINSQINKYLPEFTDHVHMQVNPATTDGSLGS